MAKVFPDGWRELTDTDAVERELQTLAQLAAGLADDYTVYHGVHWTQVERGSYAIDSRASSLPQRASPASSPCYPADPSLPADVAKAMNAGELCLGRKRFA